MTDESRTTGSVRRITSSLFRMATAPPTPVPPPPPPQLRLRLRTKLVVAMVFAALVPVVIVASIATGVILSNLEAGLREDADRQLTVGLNLILRSLERLGDETVQLSESTALVVALGERGDLEPWFAHHIAHVPSARLQILDPNGTMIFDRMVVGALTCDPAQAADANHPECRAAERFRGIGVTPEIARSLPPSPGAAR